MNRSQPLAVEILLMLSARCGIILLPETALHKVPEWCVRLAHSAYWPLSES